MFPIYREPFVSLDAIVHFLLKRIQGMDYRSLMFMPLSKRDRFFRDEYELYEKELAEAKKQ